MDASEVNALSDGEFQILSEDGGRILRRIRRLSAEGIRTTVLAVLPAARHPTPVDLERLAHEYRLRDELDVAWAVRPLAIEQAVGRTMLVLEDPGGEPLDRLVDTPMPVDQFLRLAVGIAGALRKAHQWGFVHKDIKPANIILTNVVTGDVRLTGFGIASRLPREQPAPEAVKIVSGSLAYMAPEQTGRMSRTIDARSDLYALGVTLYHMFTGSLPFTAADPAEWMHCHIARKPTPPEERRADTPPPISALIMRLLAKMPEERYQTAAGLEHDLRRCLAEWEARGRIDDLVLESERPVRPSVDSREAVWTRTRSRNSPRRIRQGCGRWGGGTVSGLRLCGGRQVGARRGTAQDVREERSIFRGRKMRHVKARHSLCNARPSIARTDFPVAR